MTTFPQTARRKTQFRPDIEGLRAIAILLVIGAHFGVPGMSGGFIGVDVFFVISGYLITGLLVREHSETSSIHLLRFYANRFRRLFPALAAMLITSSVAAYFILPETQNIAQSKAAAMAAVWVSNVHFAFADVNYFAAETSTNIFLHTWSLGVEEQFYILWPLLILLAVRTFTITRSDRAVWAMLSIVLAASLVGCLVIAQNHPVQAFYLMPTRAWQFSAGAMTWFIVSRKILPNRYNNPVALAGYLLLLAGLFLITQSTTYPGSLALLPTFATCALLWSGSNSTSLSGKVLSLKPLQKIGQVSYSWYLWHWPVLILGEYLITIKGDALKSFLAISFSLLIAIITHYLIENPIRYGQAKQVKPVWQVGVTIAAMILLNSQLLKWNTLTEDTLASQTNRYAEARFDLPFFYRDGCDDWYQSDQLKPCIYGSESAPKTAVLMGDSIGAQWFPALTRMFDPAVWKIVVLTKSACPMVDEPKFYKRIDRDYTECSVWRNKAISWLGQQKPDIIFLGSAASSSFTEQQITAGTLRILKELSPNVAEIYLIEANPILGFNGPECLMQYQRSRPGKCSISVTGKGQYARVANTLKSTVSKYENTHWLETATFVCPENNCKAERDGVVVFRDSQHLTASFTATAAPHFERQMEKNGQPRP